MKLLELRRWRSSFLGRKSIGVGSLNSLRLDSAFMRRSSLTVRGRENEVTIGSSSSVVNCRILILGNHNSITVGKWGTAARIGDNDSVVPWGAAGEDVHHAQALSEGVPTERGRGGSRS